MYCQARFNISGFDFLVRLFEWHPHNFFQLGQSTWDYVDCIRHPTQVSEIEVMKIAFSTLPPHDVDKKYEMIVFMNKLI